MLAPAIKQFPLARSVRRVASRIRRDLGVGITEIELFNITQPSHEPLGDLRIERITREQLPLLDTLAPSARAEWEQRLDRGDRCFGAWIDDELVHFSWLQTSGTHQIIGAGMFVPVADGEFWIYDCRTSSAHRGKRIYPRTLAHVARVCFLDGARTGWIYTRSDNLASRHGVVRAGFTLERTLRALRFGKRYRAL